MAGVRGQQAGLRNLSEAEAVICRPFRDNHSRAKAQTCHRGRTTRHMEVGLFGIKLPNALFAIDPLGRTVVEGLSVPALRKSLEPTPCDRDWKQFRLIETLMSSVLGARLAIGKTSAPREFSFCQTRSVTQSFRWTVDRGGQQSLVSKVASQSAQVAELDPR
jgi:hypothetical protein